MKEVEILEKIYNSNSISQRELASDLNISLGAVNNILQSLVEKNLLLINRLNSKIVNYSLSRKGMELLSRQNYRFLKSTVGSVAKCKEKIYNFIADLKNSDISGVLLIGESSLDFVVEYAVIKNGIEWVRTDYIEGLKMAYVYSENYIPDLETAARGDSFFLQEILLGNDQTKEGVFK